jgi:hypothetical protein
MATVVVSILGRQGQGRWILSAPELDFAGRVDVAAVAGEPLAEEQILAPQLLYRGRDYWLMAAPLGSDVQDWEAGVTVTLVGARQSG